MDALKMERTENRQRERAAAAAGPRRTLALLAAPSLEHVSRGRAPPRPRARAPQLLDTFWAKHDPTSKDRQGGDSGTQYRAGIYTTTGEQAEEAAK